MNTPPLDNSTSGSASSLGDSQYDSGIYSPPTTPVKKKPEEEKSLTPVKEKPEEKSFSSSIYHAGTSLFSWGAKTIISTATSGASYLGGATVSTGKYLQKKAVQKVSGLVVGQLGQIEGYEPISEDKEKTLKYLDKSGQLPKVINNCVHHLVTPEFMTENNIGGSAEDLQAYLKFMAERAIAYLACDRPEDNNNLPMNVIKNFISIINNWIVKSGLEDRLRVCRCLYVRTMQLIKEKTLKYKRDHANISKNEGDNTRALASLKSAHDDEINELHEKLAKEQYYLTVHLKANIEDLVTDIFERTKIPEDYRLEGNIFRILQVRATLERKLYDFICSFYLRALPRREASFKEPTLQCLMSASASILPITDHEESEPEFFSMADSDEDFESLSVSRSESKPDIGDLCLMTQQKEPNNHNAIISYSSEIENDNILDEILLDEVVEPELPLLQSGILGIVEVVLFNYTKDLKEVEPRKKAIDAVNGFLSYYGIPEVDLWIEQVLTGFGLPENPLIAQLRSTFVECLAYRFVEVVEKLAALKPRTGLGLLESLLLNCIELTQKNLRIQEDFSDTLQNYKNLILLDEALGWRDHYLQSQLKVKVTADKYDDEALKMRSADILAMFKLAKCNANQIKALAQILKIPLPKDPNDIEAYTKGENRIPLARFFQGSRKAVQTQLQKCLAQCLAQHFGQFAEKLLEATGLDKNEAFGFCDIFKEDYFDQIRKQTVPRLLLDVYCMVADLEERPLQKVQDEILIRFIRKYSKQKKGPNFAAESIRFGKVIKAFDEGKFLKEDEVKLFADMLAQTGYTWFSAANYYMEQQLLHVPEDIVLQLQMLDPKNKLPEFCESLRNKILVEAKKKIIKEIEKANKPFYMPAYDAINENEETHRFAELYLDSILFRILTRLACGWGERQPNGLFSNILKMTLHSIKDCNVNTMTQALLAAIGINRPSDLGLFALPFGNGKIEKMAFDAVGEQLPLLLTWLSDGFFQAQEVFEEIQGHGALRIDSGSLSQNIIPMVFRWMGGEKNRFSLSHTLKDLLDEKEIEGIDRVWIEELLVGTAVLEYDKWSLIAAAYKCRDDYLIVVHGEEWETTIATLTVSDVEQMLEPHYDKRKKKALLNAVKEPVAEDQAPQNEQEILVEFFRKDGRAEAEEQKRIHTPGKDQVQNLWIFFEQILAPRLFRVFEHTAHYYQSTGNILERILVNSICVIQQAFLEENTLLLKAAVNEYDRLSLLVEAYDWRNRYLKETKGIKAANCEEEALNLVLDEIREILRANYDRKRREAFLRAAGIPVNEEIDVDELLLEFFRKSSQDVRVMQKKCLSESFGPCAIRVLELTGLTTDAAFSFPGASEGSEGYYTLESVRTQIVPQMLMNFYRDMSDFHGVHERNMQEFQSFFGEHGEVAHYVLSTFSNIAAEKAKNYVRDNAGDIATMVSQLFPTAPLTQINMLTNAIRGIASSNSASQVNVAVSEVIHRLIEERIYASLIQFVISLIFHEGEVDSTKEDAAVNEEQTFGNFIRRKLQTGFNGSPEKSKPDSLKQNENLELEEKRVFSEMWFSNILQWLGDLFNGHREALKIGMQEYLALQEKLKKDNVLELKKEEKKAKKLQAIFRPIVQEFIEISGLSSKNLYLPEFCKEEIWETLTQETLPKLFAKFYIEMTVSQNLQDKETAELRLKLPHGPGAATGFAHLILKMLESGLAIDGNGIGKQMHSALTGFLLKSGTESGRLAAEGLGVKKKNEDNLNDELSLSLSMDEKEPIESKPILENSKGIEANAKDLLEENIEELPGCDSIKACFNEITSDAVRSGRLSGLFSAMEGYVVTPLLRSLNAITGHLIFIDEKKPHVLTKIAKDCILAAGEHFMRLHSVALKENKDSAYELVDSPSKLLEGLSLDRPILEYVFLQDKRKKAVAAYKAAKEREGVWYISEAIKAERKEMTASALNAVIQARQALDDYAETIWTDNRAAVKAYLEAANKLRIAEREEREEVSRRDYASNHWYANLINFKEEPSLEAIQRKRHTAEIQLEEAKANLQRVTINVAGGQNDAKADPLRNLCSLEGYRLRRKTLEDAEKNLKASKSHSVEEAQEQFDNALKDFEAYRINEYFKPLSEKILKLVGDEPFENLDFPSDLPVSIKQQMIKTIKSKLPEVLNTLFHTLVKPETQQGILLKFIKDANKATEEAKKKRGVKKATASEGKEKKERAEGNGFEDRCGSMALDLIEMLPKGSFRIFHRLSTVKEAIEREGGKFIGDALSNALDETSMVQLFDSLLKLALASSMPSGTWGEDDSFNSNMDPLPKDPEEVEAAKEKHKREAQQTKTDLQGELILFMENEIANPVNARIEEAGNSFLGGVQALINSVFSGETAENIFKKFENFCHNVYDLFHALVNLIASVTFWPIARWFIGTMPQNITETFSLEAHEYLIFQWVNIVMDTIDEELDPNGNLEIELDI